MCCRLSIQKRALSTKSYEEPKILGKEDVSDLEWQDVPPEGDPKLHFFTVDVEMP